MNQTDIHPLSPSHRRQPWRRPSVNLTTVERVARVAVGGLGALTASILLTSAGSVLAVILVLLLLAAGVDLIVTCALGHCPLYQRLGYVPRSLRRPS